MGCLVSIFFKIIFNKFKRVKNGEKTGGESGFTFFSQIPQKKFTEATKLFTNSILYFNGANQRRLLEYGRFFSIIKGAKGGLQCD